MKECKKIISYSFIVLLLWGCQQKKSTPPSETTAPAVSSEVQNTKADFTYKYEVRLPQGKKKNFPTLILLHGYGSNEQDLMSFAPAFPEYLIICPQAPIPLAPRKFSWYPLLPTKGGWTYDHAQLQKETQKMAGFIDEMIEHYNADPENVFLGGFSQGGIMSMTTGLGADRDLKGIICLSGQLYPEFDALVDAATNPSDYPDFFISHGNKDTVLPASEIKTDAKRMSEMKLNVETFWYDATHTITHANFEALKKWLSTRT